MVFGQEYARVALGVAVVLALTAGVGVAAEPPLAASAAPPAAWSQRHSYLEAPKERDQQVAVWVFFTDKGIDSEAAYDTAIDQVAANYHPRAVRRRRLRRSAPGLFDEHDIPVVAAYGDALIQHGARVRVRSKWLNAVSVIATRAQLDAISRLRFVKKLQPVRALRLPDGGKPRPPRERDQRQASGGTLYGLTEPQLAQMNLLALHDAGFTGQGVVIGVLDTGFRTTHEAFTHPEHPLQIEAEWDFVNDDPETANETGDPGTQHDHGTQVLGSMAAYDPGQMVGAAYDAAFILCKVEDVSSESLVEEDYFVAGLEFIEAGGGDVATSSVVIFVGYDSDDLDGETTVMTQGINIATANGVHVCQGAGNEGHDADPATHHLIPPADALEVITVGAVQSTGQIATFSSDGPTVDGRVKPEVLALGVDVITTSPLSDNGVTSPNGTSFATPLTAGVVACLVQARPTWTVQQMRTFLFETAGYFAANQTFDPNYVLGYGVVDAHAALALDCNANGVPDDDDIDLGTSDDDNDNGTPDECEAAVPAVSVSGLVIMALVLLCAGPAVLRASRTGAGRPPS